jgi:hypothetical protein
VLDRATRSKTDAIVLAAEVIDGKAVYSEASVMLVKELRALGADASFADPADDRVFEVKKSAEAAVAFVIGIGSNAAWDAMKAYLSKRKDRRLSVTYVDLESDNAKGRAWQVEGDSDGVVRAIESLRGGLGEGDSCGD